METTRYGVRFETDGADLFVELHANDCLLYTSDAADE